MSLRTVKAVFLVACLYDVILGVAFCLFFKSIYNMFEIPLPNHDGYVQLSALHILVFGIGFFFVYRDPVRNSPLILLGILMKLAFIAVALGHWILDTIPVIYIPFAVVDVPFLVLFVMAQSAVGKLREKELYGPPADA